MTLGQKSFCQGFELSSGLGAQALGAPTAAGHKLRQRSFFLQADGTYNPLAAKHHPSDRLKCGVTETVGASTDNWVLVSEPGFVKVFANFPGILFI